MPLEKGPQQHRGGIATGGQQRVHVKEDAGAPPLKVAATVDAGLQKSTPPGLQDLNLKDDPWGGAAHR